MSAKEKRVKRLAFNKLWKRRKSYRDNEKFPHCRLGTTIQNIKSVCIYLEDLNVLLYNEGSIQ